MERHEKLLTAYVGGAMPDVFQLGSTWIPEFAAIGAVAPLDEHLAASSSTGDYFAGILDANRIDGTTYGVPWYVDTRLLFYRSDLVEQAGFAGPPADWQSWVAQMAGVKHVVGPTNYAMLLPVSEWQPPVILALQRGATLLRDGDRWRLQSAAFRSAFAFYLRIFRPASPAAAEDGNLSGLCRQFFAFYISGPWNISNSINGCRRAWGRWATPCRPGKGAHAIAGGAGPALSRGTGNSAAWPHRVSRRATQIRTHRRPASPAWPGRSALANSRYAQAFWTQLGSARPSAGWGASPRITDYAEAAVPRR